ncbi:MULTISPECIES: APC family permease [Kitasatospora]|uniref:APC family permease n=1 Tax=Kitasatospora TaxID=2063 RepID=UPI0024738620|nr:APC family permease [Kitasatospora sp. GP30]MDH6145131.1 amino acid transporter [Kitasatospora sp. GP30]
MFNVPSALKRLVIGKAMRSEELGETLLPKRLALPIFASDPLSSVAYATEEILLVLTVGGTAFLYLTPWVALGVVALMAVVVLSYRQVVHAYPGGGGSYEVVTRNLGAKAGLVVAASLMVDYVMTVAVSVASGVDNIISAFPGLGDYRVVMACSFVALLAAMNLRGVRESGKAFAAPTYMFIFGILLMVATGFIKMAFGHAPVAESAKYAIIPTDHNGTLAGVALIMLGLKAFASGCTALTGVEAISNGVPAFRAPKSKNAATTMSWMGITAVVMFIGITVLALVAKVHKTNDTCQLVGFQGDCHTASQPTVIAQLASSIFGGDHSPLFYFIQAATALVLILAANTAFNGFPLLGSILAQHRYLPRQFHTRGDRLAFSNGIIALAVVNVLLLWFYKANVDNLIHLYILGVFTSFTLSQIGMVRHWNEVLSTETDPKVRAGAQRSRVINAFGACTTGLVFVIVMATKFMEGAWLAVLAAIVLFVMMRGIRKHYDSVADELTVDDPQADSVRPSKVHGIVLVSKLHKPTLRALGYAEAFRPDTLEAVTVSVEKEDTEELKEQWQEFDVRVPLKVLDSPYREITKPVVAYVRSVRRTSPRDAVAVFIPEYVVGHWWEHFLHNQSALWLKSRLLFTPGVMVISVPWQLSSAPKADHPARRGPGAVRRGEPLNNKIGKRREPIEAPEHA